MQKIPTLLIRSSDDRRHVTAGCEWVLAGKGVATRKWDGIATLLDEDGRWWARRVVKPRQPAPPDFVEVESDDVTGKRVGWVPIETSPFARWHAKAVAINPPTEPGTYELCGPMINGNPEQLTTHLLIRHGAWPVAIGRSLDQIIEGVATLGAAGIEGVVWHHPDGRMAKLKARDLPHTPTTPSTTKTAHPHGPAAGTGTLPTTPTPAPSDWPG